MKRRLFLLCILFVSGCSCEKEDLRRYKGPTFSDQTFTFSNSENKTVVTSTGFTMYIGSNTFKHRNGSNPNTVELQIKEYLAPDAMILHNMTTMSNGKALESGGMFHITATENGQELVLGPGQVIRYKLPALDYNMKDMSVFNGSIDNNGNVNWIENTGVQNQIIAIPNDSLRPSSYTYDMIADSIFYINVDKFLSGTPVTFDVLKGNATNPGDVDVFLHFKDRNSVIVPVYEALEQKFRFNDARSQQGTIIAIHENSTGIKAAFHEVNLTPNGSVALELKDISIEDLKARLKLLR